MNVMCTTVTINGKKFVEVRLVKQLLKRLGALSLEELAQRSPVSVAKVHKTMRRLRAALC